MDRDTITALTIAVRVYRQLRAMGIYDMPLKWNITAKATKARGIMDQISTEYDGFIETGSEHLADVKGLRSQVGDMKDDLQAAANVMGNGSGDVSGNGTLKTADLPKEPPKSFAGELTGIVNIDVAGHPVARLGPNPSAVDPLRPGMIPADTMKWVDQGQQEAAGEASTTFPAV